MFRIATLEKNTPVYFQGYLATLAFMHGNYHCVTQRQIYLEDEDTLNRFIEFLNEAWKVEQGQDYYHCPNYVEFFVKDDIDLWIIDVTDKNPAYLHGFFVETWDENFNYYYINWEYIESNLVSYSVGPTR